jgi:dipeptidyl aminopeptidase/acylaminoacyl peptidase
MFFVLALFFWMVSIKWEPSYSPDGTKIVFTSLQSGIPSIWIMDSDGTNKQQLTSEYPAEPPKWSPDGSKIVFASNGDIWMLTLNVTPIVTPTPEPTTTVTTPTQLTPTPVTAVPKLTPTSTPRLTPAPTATATKIPAPEEKEVPGFEAVFEIA